MTLQQRIRQDLKQAMKAKETERISALRVLLGEFGRQDAKELDDKQVLAVIRKLVKSEQETLARTTEESSPYLEVLQGYLPQAPGEEEIRAWIRANVDLAALGNKMQAMRPIMAHFGGAADGNLVRRVLESM